MGTSGIPQSRHITQPSFVTSPRVVAICVLVTWVDEGAALVGATTTELNRITVQDTSINSRGMPKDRSITDMVPVPSSPRGAMCTAIAAMANVATMTTEALTPNVGSGRSKWLPMPFIALGVAMIIVDSTIVNVAIPSIIQDIGLTTTDAEWIISIYALVFASLLLVTGRMGDIYGRRRLFALGTVIFVVASLVAALAPTPGILILGRLLQGIGGAMILPASLSTLNATYRGKDRAIAFGIWGSTIGGTAALGPLLGGWLTTSYSWRWAFLINVPLGIVIIYGLIRYVPETKDPNARRGFDLPGTLLSSIGLGALIFGLIEGQRYGWWVPEEAFTIGNFSWPSTTVGATGFAFVLSAVLLTLFVIVEHVRKKKDLLVLLNFSLFDVKSFRYGNLAALIVSLGEFGLLFALPLFLQSALGYSAFKTGQLLLALALGSFIAGPGAAGLAHKFGPRNVVRVGMALEMIGILGIGFAVSATVTFWALVPWLFIYGLGVGFATAQLTGVVMADIPVIESGQGSAVQSTSRQVGAALGTAILGAILVGTLGTALFSDLKERGVPEQTATSITAAVQSAPSEAIPRLSQGPLGADVATASTDAFVQATKNVAWAAAAFIGLGLISTLLLPRETPGLRELGE